MEGAKEFAKGVATQPAIAHHGVHHGVVGNTIVKVSPEKVASGFDETKRVQLPVFFRILLHLHLDSQLLKMKSGIFQI